MLQDPAKTLRVRFPDVPRAITNVSVWSLAAGGAARIAAAAVSVGAAGSITNCVVLPAMADPARPGWVAAGLVCGAAGHSVSLAFPGSSGPLGVRLCTVKVGPGAGMPLTAMLAAQSG